MKDFISFDDIPIGSIWMAADGGTYGYLVVGKDRNREDIIVCPYCLYNGWEMKTYRIDGFKLQYRYNLKDKV